MQLSVNNEIERFSRWSHLFKESSFHTEVPIPLSLQLTHNSATKTDPHLTFLALVHGNEVAGIAVINEMIRLLQAGLVRTKLNLSFILGNEAAAKEGKRFIHENLNRCFGLTTPKGPESERAIAMGTLTAKTKFLVDFHQTNGATDRSFFIFPFTAKSYRFARAIDPLKTIVTHWGQPFSTEGMCSDEFVNAKGGCGLTIELGQAGFNNYQINDGILCALRALYVVEAIQAGRAPSDLSEIELDTAGEIFTFAHVQKLPKGADVSLKPGWQNFSPVAIGDLIGRIDGRDFLAERDGRIMFPYYPNKKIAASAPDEAWRILRPLQVKDLPW